MRLWYYIQLDNFLQYIKVPFHCSGFILLTVLRKLSYENHDYHCSSLTFFTTFFTLSPVSILLISFSIVLQINAATDSAVRNLRNRNHTPQTIHANLCTQFQKLLQSIQTLVSRRRFPKQISNMTESHKSWAKWSCFCTVRWYLYWYS